MIRSAAAPRRRTAGFESYLRAVLAVAGLVLAVMTAAVSTAAAHAVLLATDPADESVLETQPVQITLRFNEPVAPVFVRVIGPDGQAVSTPDTLTAIDTELRLSLPPNLPAGGYLVSYRVVSADSHPVGGSFSFAIGTKAVTPPRARDETAGREGLWQAAKVLLRFVQSFGLMLAAGGALFQLLVLRADDRVPGLALMVGGGAVIAILAAGLGVGVQGGLPAAAPAAALLDPQTWRLGASTSVGTATFVQVPALAIVAFATFGSSGRLGRILAALGALVAATSLALTGHSAAVGWPAQLPFALHAATVAFWLGALWPLHTILRTQSPDKAAILVRRFSTLAVPAVALLIAAGIATTLTRVDDPASLIESDYGRILLLKLAFVAVLLTIAVINRHRVTPDLAGGSGRATAVLAQNIRFELVLAGAILAITAVLAHTAPPHESVEHDHEEHVQEAAPAYAVVTVSRGHMLFLEVAPARVGANSLTLSLTGMAGRPLTPIELRVALSLPAAGIEPLVRMPERIGEGRYTLARLDLPTAGRWSVRVDALISDFEKVIFTTEVPIR